MLAVPEPRPDRPQDASSSSGRSGRASRFVLGLSLVYRRKLGLYGQVVASGIGFVGLFLVGFWLFAAIFGQADRALRSARADRRDEGRAAGRDRSALRPALSVRRRQAGARRVQPRHRRRAHRARSSRRSRRCSRSRSASPSAFRPAISAGASTRSCRSWPIWCWPSRSSSCSTCWCRRASWRRRFPIRWRRSSSPSRSRSSACSSSPAIAPSRRSSRSGWRSPSSSARGCSPPSSSTPIRSASSRSARARSTSSSPSRSPPVPASSASCAA